MRQAWFRVFGCGICHRTGVVISPRCECKPAWGNEPCEAYCSTTVCPRHCRMTTSRDEALAVWRRYWPPREQLEMTSGTVDLPSGQFTPRGES